VRYLGLDLGTKTLGVAISRSGIIVNKLNTIRHENNLKFLLNEVIKICEEESIDLVVLGYPKNMNNTIGEKALYIEKFKKLLESRKIKVKLQDERLSTVSAEKMLINFDVSRQKRKEIIDSVAATIILEDYLKRRNNG
jgi:RNAse H domain protein, YqgF family